MKKHLLLLAVAASLLAVAPAALADRVPEYPIQDALNLAQKVLAERNEPNVYIESIVLTRSSVFSAKRHWFITWSRPLTAQTANTREVGLSISMDGRAARVVK